MNPTSDKIEKYRSEIEEMICDCEHVYRLTIDYDLLDSKITELVARANADGLNEKVIMDLVHSLIPSYVNYKNFKISRKKAA